MSRKKNEIQVFNKVNNIQKKFKRKITNRELVCWNFIPSQIIVLMYNKTLQKKNKNKLNLKCDSTIYI